MPDRKPKRRKRGRINESGQTPVSVYFYPDELDEVRKAAEDSGYSISGYIALAAKARAVSDLKK